MQRFVVVVICAFASGCAATVEEGVPLQEHRLIVPHAARPLSERAKRILILESETINQPTEVLGLVDVHEPVGSQEEALDELREHADELGADAVLGVEFHHGEAGPAPTHLSGMAVRFNDLIKGRHYDVIQEIEASAPMGHEEEADRALGEKARALHADLIVGVTFEHGEGEGGVRCKGKAIRFADR